MTWLCLASPEYRWSVREGGAEAASSWKVLVVVAVVGQRFDEPCNIKHRPLLPICLREGSLLHVGDAAVVGQVRHRSVGE